MHNTPEIDNPLTDVKTAEKLGLLEEEFEKIKEILGRTPNFTELSIFSVMWSEHCSYKNSIIWLKKLPKDSPRMLAKAGEENAGLVDIGDGLACSFKIESHNHPSAIEPYQGAATGVGGINRDIFTMGARPIAQLNSLRFGNPNLDKTKRLIRGIVKGIGDYGNAFGIPTVGGEVYFDDCYTTNPLVNAFSAGIVKTGKTASAISYGVGNPVFIVGSDTGKDGVKGASFASKDITKDSLEDLPSVQIGDPFREKLLLEATLEILATDDVIGIQDMGAAGIICSTSEMSAKGKHGMIIWLDKVPTRQSDMQPFEILLSESQERMLIVVKKGREENIQTIFDKWDLNCEQIGEVTDNQRLNFYVNNELVADVPADDLVLGGGAPVYHREYKEPAYFQEFKKFKTENMPEPKNLSTVAKILLGRPNICSRNWISQQYDSMVGTANMSTNNPSDSAIISIHDTEKAIAVTVDCNARHVYADPEEGCAAAVAEAARNIVCSGGTPLAITNCLNFGNPYNPEVYWQFVGAIKGMKKACERFQTPVTGGNVSFYNQSPEGGPVHPTPVIGMLGLLENKENRMTLDFKNEGDLIYLIGTTKNCIAGSEYLFAHHNITASPPPYFDLEEEITAQETVKNLIGKKLILSAHDISEGGLIVTLFESAAHRKLGFAIQTDNKIRKDAFLFGESKTRIIVSVDPSQKEAVEDFIEKSKTEMTLLGHVTAGDCQVDDELFFTIAEASEIHENILSALLD